MSYPKHIIATATQATENLSRLKFDTHWKPLISQQEEVVPGVENLQVLNLVNVPSLGQGPSEA